MATLNNQNPKPLTTLDSEFPYAPFYLRGTASTGRDWGLWVSPLRWTIGQARSNETTPSNEKPVYRLLCFITDIVVVFVRRRRVVMAIRKL